MEGTILKQIQLLHAKLDSMKLDTQGMQDHMGLPDHPVKKEENEDDEAKAAQNGFGPD